MQDDRIHWNGQPIALVLAETQEQADHAKSLIRVDLRDEPAVTVVRRSQGARAPSPTSFQGEPPEIDRRRRGGAGGRGLQVDRDLPHAAPQPQCDRAARGDAGWEGDELIVHDATQMRAHAPPGRWPACSGCEESRFASPSPYVGGGFGGKRLWQHQILGAAAAKLAGRPVRIALSREGVFRLVGGRTATEQRVAIGARRTARFAAMIHTGVVAMTTHNACPEQFTFPARHLCRRAIKLRQRGGRHGHARQHLHARAGRVGRHLRAGMRAGRAGRGAGLDPIELRRRIEPEKDPTSGTPFSSRHLVEALRRAPKRFGWASATRSRGPARRRVAGRHGLRDRDLPVLPHARRRRPHHASTRTATRGADGQPRDGHGHRDRAGPGRGRPAGPAAGPGDASTTATRRCPARAGRRVVADRLDRRGRDRRAPTR